MTYTVIDNGTNFVTRGVDSFVVHNMAETKAAIIKDSTLIEKGLKYPSEFISEFVEVFKGTTSQEVNNVVLTVDAEENMLRIMLFNREDS